MIPLLGGIWSSPPGHLLAGPARQVPGPGLDRPLAGELGPSTLWSWSGLASSPTPATCAAAAGSRGSGHHPDPRQLRFATTPSRLPDHEQAAMPSSVQRCARTSPDRDDQGTCRRDDLRYRGMHQPRTTQVDQSPGSGTAAGRRRPLIWPTGLGAGPLGGSAAAPGGALRPIDSSARPRPWAGGFGRRRLRRQSQPGPVVTHGGRRLVSGRPTWRPVGPRATQRGAEPGGADAGTDPRGAPRCCKRRGKTSRRFPTAAHACVGRWQHHR
jgi:hypothetical protein